MKTKQKSYRIRIRCWDGYFYLKKNGEPTHNQHLARFNELAEAEHVAATCMPDGATLVEIACRNAYT
jgi:hypothetical protein